MNTTKDFISNDSISNIELITNVQLQSVKWLDNPRIWFGLRKLPSGFYVNGGLRSFNHNEYLEYNSSYLISLLGTWMCNYTKEELSKQFFVENNKVYEKPKVLVHLKNGHTLHYYFDTNEDANIFISQFDLTEVKDI